MSKAAAAETAAQKEGAVGDRGLGAAPIGRHEQRHAPRTPPPPRKLADLGLETNFVVGLLCKTIYRLGLEQASVMAERLHLPIAVTNEIVQIGIDQKLLEAKGQLGASVTAEMRYELTNKGRAWALEAFQQSDYVGAVPVTLEEFSTQASTQSIRGEVLTRPALENVFTGLTLAPTLMRHLGPAANSGASMLLYGPPGNGKSSIAEALCRGFGHHVWLPYAIEVDRQVITLFDPAVHRALTGEELEAAEADLRHASASSLRRQTTADRRYIACRRPKLIAGGELTLDMLDLSFSSTSRIYEAPMQLKACGGVLVIDDFGRQRQHPQEIINRMIIPLENGVDFLALQSGRKFEAPFDSLVVFSTNIPPSDLVDEAALRRLRYKILVDSPDQSLYLRILAQTAQRAGLALREEVVEHMLTELYAKQGKRYQAFHPRFMIDQAYAICAYEGIEPELSVEVIERAWENLFPVD
ncbi:MAG: AAA family ATPase [Pseudomonadota bacterium]